MGQSSRKGFTLVELLVVIGIIALLISILLPSLNAARQSANTLKCASNMRQLATALVMYSAENKGKFPPNATIGGVSMAWFDADRIGRYLPKTVQLGSGSIGGPVFQCTNDVDGVQRSYVMNHYASSVAAVVASRGQLWGPGVKRSSEMMLMLEGWAKNYVAPGGTNPPGWYTSGTAGYEGATPGERFLGITGYQAKGSPTNPYYNATTEVAFVKHAKRGQSDVVKPVGRMNVAFSDTHVELLAVEDLADRSTRTSTMRGQWSPKDVSINK